jgi:hypothetical protein
MICLSIIRPDAASAFDGPRQLYLLTSPQRCSGSTSNLSATTTAWAKLDHLVPRQISDGFDQSRSRLLTMSRPMGGQVAIAVLLGVLVGSCWGAERPAEMLPRTDAARLRQLGLTSEIPTRVREACGKERRRVTVRVLCPKLIPDVPLFRPGGACAGPLPSKRLLHVEL